eukprot:jgi/Mesen1/9128/ME000058S08617
MNTSSSSRSSFGYFGSLWLVVGLLIGAASVYGYVVLSGRDCRYINESVEDSGGALDAIEGQQRTLAAVSEDAVRKFDSVYSKVGSKVWMHRDEAFMIAKYLHPNQTMHEWGSGGSTILFSQFVAAYDSVEHNPQWITKVEGMIKEFVPHPQTITYRHVASHYMGPKTPSGGGDFAEYVLSIPDKQTFDHFLVDGRARVQCAVEALRHFRDPERGLLFMHDFWHRPNYFIVLAFFDVVEQHYNHKHQTLAVLSPKSNWRDIVANFSFPPYWDQRPSDGSPHKLHLLPPRLY